ncbi:unnamed protein product [Closterium sp. NIES-65]|nr:unnamed protein product [Closterium sp. NIES-65]
MQAWLCQLCAPLPSASLSSLHPLSLPSPPLSALPHSLSPSHSPCLLTSCTGSIQLIILSCFPGSRFMLWGARCYGAGHGAAPPTQVPQHQLSLLYPLLLLSPPPALGRTVLWGMAMGLLHLPLKSLTVRNPCCPLSLPSSRFPPTLALGRTVLWGMAMGLLHLPLKSLTVRNPCCPLSLPSSRFPPTLALGRTVLWGMAMGLLHLPLKSLTVRNPCCPLSLPSSRFPPTLALGRTVLQGMAMGLHLPLDTFEHGRADDPFWVIRDPGITALQVKNKAGEWVDAPPVPGSFVVNIGDMLKPNFDARVEPVDALVKTMGRSRLEPVVYGDHLCKKVFSNFG